MQRNKLNVGVGRIERRTPTTEARRELTPAPTHLSKPILQKEFPDLHAAHHYLNTHGYRPRIGGGYEHNSHFAHVVQRGPVLMLEEFAESWLQRMPLPQT